MIALWHNEGRRIRAKKTFCDSYRKSPFEVVLAQISNLATKPEYARIVGIVSVSGILKSVMKFLTMFEVSIIKL